MAKSKVSAYILARALERSRGSKSKPMLFPIDTLSVPIDGREMTPWEIKQAERYISRQGLRDERARVEAAKEELEKKRAEKKAEKSNQRSRQHEAQVRLNNASQAIQKMKG